MADQVKWNKLGILCRLIVGGVFIYASVDKMVHPAQFAEILYNYKILPTELVNLAAIVMPWIEMLAGIFLVLGIMPLSASFILTSLVVVFIAAISFNLARGLDFQCGCFTTSADAAHSNWLTLYRDLALLIPCLLAITIYWPRRRNVS